MRIIGIDYGDSRVGISVCDPLMITAQGVSTVANKVYSKMLDSVAEIINTYGAQKIVIGNPKNMNGSDGDRVAKTRAFADDLSQRFPDAEIVFWDERLTTVQAAGILNTTDTRGKNRKNVIDTVAACIILQSFLDYQKGE